MGRLGLATIGILSLGCLTTCFSGDGEATPSPLVTSASIPALEVEGSTSVPSDAGGTESVVRPGAFCAPAGALGVTHAGTLMECRAKGASDRARWRRVHGGG